MGTRKSEKIWSFLNSKGLIDNRGKVQESLKVTLKNNSLKLPKEFRALKVEVTLILKKLSGKLKIRNADERKTIHLNKEKFLGEDFKQLWERIKYKTTYRVRFNNERLISDAAKAIEKCPPITKTRARFRKAGLEIGKGGVNFEKGREEPFTTIQEMDIELPDIITELQNKTYLTRGSIVKILQKCRRLNEFARNPQQFIEMSIEAINRNKRLALVDGIKYHKIGEKEYYAQELFEQEELKGYLRSLVPAKKSVYKQIIYDSVQVEKNFAEDLEANEAVKVYVKLPSWFQVPTPLGSYNPDWAILIEVSGEEKLYFVVETKFSTWWDDLGHKESAKSLCGEKHFEAIAADKNPARYIRDTSVDGVFRYLSE